MAESNEEFKSMKELFVHELKDILGAEKMILKALPKMREAATSPTLQQAFDLHLQQTEGQVERLEKVFSLLGEEVEAEECKGIKGIITEGEDMLKKKMTPQLIDASLIMSAQKVEHYEISAYGALSCFAEELGMSEVKELLGQNLEEEKQTDLGLNEIAISEVNLAAKESSQEQAA